MHIRKKHENASFKAPDIIKILGTSVSVTAKKLSASETFHMLRRNLHSNYP